VQPYRRPRYLELRERILEYPDESVKLGMMYQDIICGRESEVCGEGVDGVYAAHSDNVFQVKYLGETDAILFANRSAKRRGFYRPIMVPLNPKYEPFTKPLLDHFQDTHDYCFKYGPTWDSSMRVYRREVAKCFKGLYWPRVEYSRSVAVKISKDQIIREGINQNNKPVAFVDLDGQPKWYTLKDNGSILAKEIVPTQWKPCSSHIIRKSRERQLELQYQFTGLQISIYGGWTYKGKDQNLSDALRHYQYDPIIDPQDNIDILIKAAETYFEKLLIPYGERAEGTSYVINN